MPRFRVGYFLADWVVINARVLGLVTSVTLLILDTGCKIK